MQIYFRFLVTNNECYISVQKEGERENNESKTFNNEMTLDMRLFKRTGMEDHNASKIKGLHWLNMNFEVV